MRSVSNAFITAMASSTAFKEYADITLSDSTVLSLEPSDFIVTGNYMVDGAGTSGFPLGLAIQRQIQLQIMNDSGTYSGYDFLGASIQLYLVFNNETLQLGTYTATTPATYGKTITIIGFDDMHNADTAYIAGITFPASAASLFSDVCSCCGITAGSTSFANSTFEIENTPAGTCREILAGIGLIAGGNARVDDSGLCQIISYSDTSTQTLGAWNQLTVETSDTEITGLTAETANGNVIVGDDPYILPVSCVFDGQEEDILTLISSDIIGLTFRVFSGEHIANPLIEFMDYVTITRGANSYYSFVTDSEFHFCNFTVAKNSAATSIDSGRVYGSSESQLRKQVNSVQSKVTQLDDEITSKIWQTDIDEAVATRVRTYVQARTRSTRALVTKDGHPIYTKAGNPIQVITWEPPIPGYNLDVEALGVGDLWFDSGDGYRQYRWNGTAWEDVRDEDISAASLALSEISQKLNSITLRVIGPDGQTSEIQLTDQGHINLLGSVIAERINVDELFAEDITATGTFQVNNDKISLIADDNGVRITPQSWTSTEFKASLGLHRTYTILTGSVTQIQGTSQIDVNSEGLLNLSGSLGVTISGGTASPAIGIQMQSDTKPVITNTFSLGDSSTRWKYIYLNNNPSVSSDRETKHDIVQTVPDIVDGLIPVSYKRNGGGGETHYGFIAQDVESALESAGVATDSLGVITFEDDNGKRTNYALSYEEFIPLLTAKIQKQQKQIDNLEKRIEQLERMVLNA